MPRKQVKTESERHNRPAAGIQVVKESPIKRVAAFFSSPTTRIVCGVLMLSIALFLSIAFFSFFFSGKADYSLIEMSHSDRVANRRDFNNALGMPGAMLASLLIDRAFGVLSIGLIVMLIVYGLKIMHVIQLRGWRIFFRTSFWIIWGSLLLGFLQDIIGFKLFFRLGGAHGEFFTAWLKSYIQSIGVTMLLLITLVIFLIITDKHFIERIRNLWLKIAESIRNRREKKAASTVEEPVSEQPQDESEISISIDINNPSDENTDIIVSDPSNEIELTFTTTSDEPQIIDEEPIDGNKEEDDDENSDNTPDIDIQEPQDVELAKDDPKYLLEKFGPYDPRKDLENFQFPSLSLLKTYDNETAPVIDQEEQKANANRIVTTLRNYGVEIETIKATVGPTVTLYELVPKAGVKISKIQSLENDIMMSLAATGIRIIAPMPGKGTVGIEVPNEKPQVVSMHSVIASKRFQEEHRMRLPIAYGRTITNEVFMFDLAKTPHLLVAGATGTGKSVAINAIITSLLYKKHPSELKLVMVDPKMVEFAPYKPLLKHYLAAMPDTDPNQVVITDCDKVINTLNSLVIEMENRYKLLMDAGVRNVEDYNDKFIMRRLNPEKMVDGGLHHQYLPYIVMIIDEYGDFIMQAGKQVETPIARITQKARAVGMHMILATQRPSVNIVTGVIKANIPTRIALRTQSVIDSRTVLDTKGAEQLVGRGDSLHSGGASTTRVQCAFVDTPEVDSIVEHIAAQQHYLEPYPLPEYIPEGQDDDRQGAVDAKHLDSMFEEVARYVVSKQEGSTSRLQRAFGIGYNRAGKLSDQLEAMGVVGPNKGSKGRDVLIQDMQTLENLLNQLHNQ